MYPGHCQCCEGLPSPLHLLKYVIYLFGSDKPTCTVKALPPSSYFPEEQFNTEVKWPIQARSPPQIWTYAFSFIRKGVSPNQVISSPQGQ